MMRLLFALLFLFPLLAHSGHDGKPHWVTDLKQLGSRFGGYEQQLLPPDEAFGLNVKPSGASTLVVDFRVTKNYYLYRERLAFSLQNAPGTGIAEIALPKGDIKNDPLFGMTEVYHKPFKAVITLKQGSPPAEKLTLNATFQGCNEPIGVCYPPINKSFDLVLPVIAAAASAVSPPAAAALPGDAARDLFPQETKAGRPIQSESSQIAELFKGGSLWLIALSFLGIGLLLSFTPCVFPMIPILSGIIAGQGEHLTKTRAFFLSLSYVLGMAITYAAAGVAAGLSGTMLSAALQNAWVLTGFALVFVLLAFSMFGFYELQLPGFLQSKLSGKANRIHGGHVTGVFGMGALSALIVGPCVTAPLAGALLVIAQTGDVFLGGTALFSMALGMGLPLLLVGTSAGALLPKAGPWMTAVNRFFGVVLLGVAIWLISPVIPAVVYMLLWAALLIVSAIYLHTIDPLPPDASGFKKFWKGIGVIALLTGVALLIGALSGGRDILQPLSGLRVAGLSGGQQTAHLNFQRVKSVAELEARFEQSRGKYVMLDFYADWCVSCKEMERFTFSDAKVQARLKDVVLLQADVTADSVDAKALLKKFDLFGPPGILFFDKNSKEIPGARVIGTQDAEKFLATLNAVLI